MLASGNHTAELQYRTASGRVAFFDDADVTQSRQIAVLFVPANDMAFASFTDSMSGLDDQTWTSLPGTAFKVVFRLAFVSSVVVFVDFSRIQHTTQGKTTDFRILVSGTTVGRASWSGTCDGTCANGALSFHGVTQGLAAGSHTAEVQYKTTAGNTLLLSHDDTNGTGRQARRITVVAARQDEVNSSSWVLDTSTAQSSTQVAPLNTTIRSGFTVGEEMIPV